MLPNLGSGLGVLTRGIATATAAAAQQAGSATGSKVGFIGLGKMGAAMLGHLVQQGHQAVVFDSNKVALERAVSELKGVTAASNPADVASTAGVDILFTMLPHPDTVRSVYLGKDGIMEAKGGPMAALMVDCSTVDPPTARKIAEAAGRVRLHPQHRGLPGVEDEDSSVLVDAPVTGGVLGATKGTLSFMVGCDEQVLDTVKPYLLKMGQFVTYCGGHGNGQAAKLCNTLAMAATMAATSESLALARRLGVDPKVMTEVLNHGAGGSWCSQHYNPVPGICPDAPPSHGFKAGMSVDGIIEQLDMLVAAGEHSHSPVPLARYLKTELFDKIHSEGLGDKDFSSIFRYYYGSGDNTEQWMAGDRLFNSHAP